MKIIKITSMACPSCIIMSNNLNIINEKYNYNIEVKEYDYDFDDVSSFNIGTILPVFIFTKNGKEISRLIGEHTKEEIEQEIKGMIK